MERSDLHRNVGFVVHDVARLMRVAFDRRGKELGLTRSQWWVLTALYANEGVTQSELADFMDLEKATLGRLLDRLEEKNWIERRPDPIDRRIKRVYLTDTVQGLMRELRSIAADIRRDAVAGLSETEQERLYDLLSRVKGNLQGFEPAKTSSVPRSAQDTPPRQRDPANDLGVMAADD